MMFDANFDSLPIKEQVRIVRSRIRADIKGWPNNWTPEERKGFDKWCLKPGNFDLIMEACTELENSNS